MGLVLPVAGCRLQGKRWMSLIATKGVNLNLPASEQFEAETLGLFA